MAFFGITFAVTWAAWFSAPLVDAPGAGGHSAAWTLLIYVGTFAPGITAVAMSAAEGRDVLRDLLRRLVKADAAPRLYLFAVMYLFALKLLNAAIQRAAFGEWPVIATQPFPLLLVATFFSTVIGGQAGEELGWRGFALPRLASRMGYAWAGVLVGVAWALWHLPLFLIPGADKTGQSFPVWALGVVALSVAMTWLWV
ncbi:MAG: CPBP family intramembrane glutamic endopeptidase, partial [Gemmatimonadota bacterium]|nr:CPBP family intramembrane glutamic endopeptidase [Gemmatimonadota bacterium]